MEIQQLQQELARTKAELEAWRQEAEHLRAAANTISRRPHSLIPCAQSVLDLACHGQAFNGSQPLQVTLEDLISVSEANGLATVLCRYSELEDEQSLGDLVRSLVASGTLVADPALPAPLGPGNHNKDNIIYASPAALVRHGGLSLEQFQELGRRLFTTQASKRVEWDSSIRMIMTENYKPLISRTVFFETPPQENSFIYEIIAPVIILENRSDEEQQHGVQGSGAQAEHQGEHQHKGQRKCRRWWGQLRQFLFLPLHDPVTDYWAMLDVMMLRYTRTAVTLLRADDGAIMLQNYASTAFFGTHGAYVSPSLSMQEASEAPADFDFLELLLWDQKDELPKVREMMAVGSKYNNAAVEIVHPRLRAMMGLQPGVTAYHDVTINALVDPISCKKMYMVSQDDVTSRVLAEQKVAELNEQQEELLSQILPPQVIEKLLGGNTPVLGQTSESPFTQHPHPGPLQAAPSLDREASLDGSGSTWGLERGGSAVLSLYSEPSMLSAQLQGGGPRLSRRDVMALATHHEQVSILFADIKGFTSMSQQLHPSGVMLFLNNLYLKLDALLEEHDVYKVETIGDCYVVCAGLFDRSHCAEQPEYPSTAGTPQGAPQRQRSSIEILARQQRRRKNGGFGTGTLGGLDPHHARKMLAFAKAMVQVASSVTNPLGEKVQLRVGIHCGSIMSGVVGRRMPRFTLFGDTVNTASRMESTGVPGRIHVSSQFMEQLPQERWLHTGGVEAKGKGLLQTAFLDWELDMAPKKEDS